jgi:hypothetical protein
LWISNAERQQTPMVGCNASIKLLRYEIRTI